MKRKKRVKWLACLTLGLLLVGGITLLLGGGMVQAQQKTIRFWSKQPVEGGGAYFPQVIKNFESKYPDIKVVLTSGTAATSVPLRAQFAAGDPPEVFSTVHTYFKDFAERGVLVELTDFYKQNNWMDRFYPMALDWGTVDGKLYGVSSDTCCTLGYYYNVGIFEELGLTEPEDLPQLLDVCEKIRKTGRIPLLRGFQAGWPAVHFYCYLSAQTAGIDPVLEAGETHEWDHPTLVEAARIFKELFDLKVFDARETGVTHEGGIAAFAGGQSAMITTGTFFIVMLRGTVPKDFRLGYFEKPVRFVDDPKSIYPGSMGVCMCIPKENKHPKESMLFLKHLYSEESLKLSINIEGNITPDPEINKLSKDPIVKMVTAKQFPKLTRDSLFFLDYVPAVVRDGISGPILELISGRISPEECMQKVKEISFEK